ncbi:histidine triad nucleotide-binding protein [Bythopirellula goksoeyrii]|uniref:HIT-like protein n=1 Tax=Bythopirellula goksoeyrii TaxID=1400387 RepID=A0A5B9QTC4_9BACT|nr:histidine triad nucleotide-binding protein [Bythopirellula goksoeyrii]QEG37361.1 HIT-like protein [Bythopirellula goksoeyrii]
MEKTLFEKIADKEIPAEIVYEDDQCVAFRDVNPQAPTHVLVIPREPIPSLESLAETNAPLLGHLWMVIRDVARQEGIAQGGYRVVVNCGQDGGQTVDHLHFHVLGGRPLQWPPG